MKKAPYTYAICRLDSKHWREIPQELASRGYTNIKLVVPVISMPSKNRKNRGESIEVPYLFNYGFMRMSTKRAFNRNFLRKLKNSIPGIKGWLHNTVPMHSRKLRKRVDNAEDWDDFSQVATISRDQVALYKKLAKEASIYSNEEILKLSIGSYLVLDFYPFEGMGAILRDLNLNTKMVSLEIDYEDSSLNLNIKVPMAQVIYTPYKNLSDEESLIADSPNFVNIEELEYGEVPTTSLGMFD